VAVHVDQHVVQLQVAVDDAAAVQELQRQHDLGRVEARVLLGQAALALHVEHQVAAGHELDDEEEPARGRGLGWARGARAHLLGVWKHECSPTRNGWLEAISNTCFSVCTQSMSCKRAHQPAPAPAAQRPAYFVVGHHRLLDHLHRVHLARALVLHLEHLGVRAAADDFEEREVVQTHATHFGRLQ